MDSVRIGSEEHKRLFCRTFVETHDPFKPEPRSLAGPRRGEPRAPEGPARLERGRAHRGGNRRQGAGARPHGAGSGPRRGDRLQGYEEGRHADVIQRLTSPLRHPGQAVSRRRSAEGPDLDVPADRLRRVPGLVLRVRPLLARQQVGPLSRKGRRGIRDDHAGGGAAHPLHRQLGRVPARAAPAACCARPSMRGARWNIVAQALDRVRRRDAARRRRRERLRTASRCRATRASRTSRCGPSWSSASSENERRFAAYDRRLLRPILVPSAVKAILKVLPRGKSATPSSAAA